MSEILGQPGILAIPRSLSAQDPTQPKIPVSPRSHSTQDPSQHWMPSCLFGSCLFDVWLMPIWYLAHAIVFGSCEICINQIFQAYITYLLGFKSCVFGTCTFSQSKKHTCSSNIMLCNTLIYSIPGGVAA